MPEALHDELKKQYFVSRSDCLPDRPQWRKLFFGEYYFRVSSDLPIIQFKVHDELIGLALGWFTDGNRFFGADCEFYLTQAISLQEIQESFSGRYVIFRTSISGLTCETDASGMMPAVFDVERDHIASSPAACAAFVPVDRDAAILQQVSRPDGKVWYPFGLTPYKGIRRLMPNETLVLGHRIVSRLWGSKRARVMADAETVLDAFHMVTSNLSSIAMQEKVEAHLTGGRDSRMVAAAAIAGGTELDFFTIRVPGSSGRLDCHIASRIARIAHLKYRQVEFLPPSISDLEAWYERTGYCIKDSVALLAKTVEANDRGTIVITGTAGEVGRAFYWSASDIDQRGCTPEELLTRLGFHESTILLSEARIWLDQFDSLEARTRILDLAYVYIRLCCWAGPSAVGHRIARTSISPFNSIRVLSAFLALSESYRAKQQLASDFVHCGAPALLEVPFNRASGIYRVRFPQNEIKRVLPKGIIRTLKRTFAR